MAKEDTLQDRIEKERTRLDEARADAIKRRAAIDDELAEIDRLLNAANAYEAALTGKSTSRKGTGTASRTPGRTAGVLQLLKDNPDGFKRADLMKKLGVSGDKKQENSVSTALANLKKKGEVDRKTDTGHWVAA